MERTRGGQGCGPITARSIHWRDGERPFRKFRQNLMEQSTHQCPGTMLWLVTRMSGRDLPLSTLFTIAQKPKNTTQGEAWSFLPPYHYTAEKMDHPPLRLMLLPNMDWVVEANIRRIHPRQLHPRAGRTGSRWLLRWWLQGSWFEVYENPFTQRHSFTHSRVLTDN